MKPCHEKNDITIYVGRAATVHNPFFFFFNVHSTVEYLNRNVSIGQLLQQIDFARSRPKMLTKTYNKEVSQASKLFPFQPINYAKRKPEKKYPGMNGIGEPMTSGIPVQCSTN